MTEADIWMENHTLDDFNGPTIALIQKTNAPSLKAFIRAGFGQ